MKPGLINYLINYLIKPGLIVYLIEPGLINYLIVYLIKYPHEWALG